MKSLRARIFVLVAAMTVLVWSSAAAWSYFSTRSEVRRVLDRRLVEAARMVASLGIGAQSLSGNSPAAVPVSAYSRQLSCQIWSLDGRLIGRSSGAPVIPLATAGTGFSEPVLNGETWRVYSLVQPESGIRVIVGDNLKVRQNLIGGLMAGLLLPALAGLAALAVLTWAAVGRGLAPLHKITRALQLRNPSDARPLGIRERNRELEPVIQAIDGLFDRLEKLRANERHFIASAAHELQTPLAGLQTHAQVALMSRDAATRVKSLRSIQKSVERTGRLVRQLLELAREESGGDWVANSWADLPAVVHAVADELHYPLTRHHVVVDALNIPPGLHVPMDEAALSLALRNLVENAINHSPADGTVRIDASLAGKQVRVVVSDTGPGIRPEEMRHVRERFVRGTGAKGAGSGLGLSIVDLVLGRAGARLELDNAPDCGLRATIIFSDHRTAGGQINPAKLA